jgi:hypothetical protein
VLHCSQARPWCRWSRLPPCSAAVQLRTPSGVCIQSASQELCDEDQGHGHAAKQFPLQLGVLMAVTGRTATSQLRLL